MRILIPDAGGYSSKLKAVYLNRLCQMVGHEVSFLPVDDDPLVLASAQYKDLGLKVHKESEGFDAVLPVSTATRCLKHGYMPKTPAKTLSIFDNKANLRYLAEGYEIPYMSGLDFNLILGSDAIVKPEKGSGSKGIRELSLATHGVIEDHDVIQAKSDDDREYVVDMLIHDGPEGQKRVWAAMRQSIQRYQGRDTEVKLLTPNNSDQGALEITKRCRKIANHITGLVHDPMWFNIQMRWWRNEIRVMEIDSRMSGSVQVSPSYGRRLMVYLGVKTEEYGNVGDWLQMSKSARDYAYQKLNLPLIVDGKSIC